MSYLARCLLSNFRTPFKDAGIMTKKAQCCIKANGWGIAMNYVITKPGKLETELPQLSSILSMQLCYI